jgi:hypothetical protein
MKTNPAYLFLALTIAAIIFISGCAQQGPAIGVENVSVGTPNTTAATNVSAAMPDVTVTVEGKPYDNHGLAMLNLTIKIQGDISEYLTEYVVLVNAPDGTHLSGGHTISKGNMADGIENIVIEMGGNYKTPAPGSYQLEIIERTQNPSAPVYDRNKERDIYRKPLGTFAGADLKVLEGTYLEYSVYSSGSSGIDYEIDSANMTFRNDGGLPAYPFLLLNIDGEVYYSGGFTAGELDTTKTLLPRGIGPGETVNGYFGMGGWLGKNAGFPSGSHSAIYTIYNIVYHPDIRKYVPENITTFNETVVFSKR